MTTKKIQEPAVDPATTTPTVASSQDIDQAVHLLLEALGIDERDLRGLEILASGMIRYSLTDNSARGKKISPLKRYERDREGRIVK